MVKISTHVSLEDDLYYEAKTRRVNLSSIINDFLRSYLEMPRDETDNTMADVDAELIKVKASATKLEQQKKSLEQKKMERFKHLRFVK